MIKYDPEKHHRHSIRLKGFNYAQAGAYFVTICVDQRECLLGEIADGDINLNEYGEIVQAQWENIANHFEGVESDVFVVMPNHLHGIIVIGNDDSTGGAKHFCSSKNASPLHPHGTQLRSLGAIVQNFKSVSTRKINQARNAPGVPVWQRNYYERIIRNDRELAAIRAYIEIDPADWEADTENPKASHL